jgi:hypothetical protein
MMRRSLAAAVLLVLAVACDNAGEDLGLPGLPQGAVGVGVILDRDGSGTPTSFDTTLSDVRVALFTEAGHDTVATATTDDDGVAIFTGVPIGRYRFALVPASLGDTLPVVTTLDTESLRVVADPSSATTTAQVLVGYATLTLTEARAAPPGRPVFVRGLVASAMQYHPDSATYLTDGAAYLRVIPSVHRPGRSGNNVGDSVIVFGTTGRVAGQPVLRDGVVATVGERPAPIPVTVSIGEIPGARGGALDAALIAVDSAVIADTLTEGPQLVVRLAAHGDTAVMRVDSTLHLPSAAFAPEHGIRFRGILVPFGDGTWYVRPRPLSSELFLLY